MNVFEIIFGDKIRMLVAEQLYQLSARAGYIERRMAQIEIELAQMSSEIENTNSELHGLTARYDGHNHGGAAVVDITSEEKQK